MARRRWGRWVLGAYLALVGASDLWRSSHPVEPRLGPGERTVLVPKVEGDREVAGSMRIALLDVEPGDSGAAPTPILLLHGSPGSHGEVTALARLLGGSRRAVAPDLPGFGASTRDLPDYSLLAHARATLALLDSLGIGRAHLLGFSMGGGVAISMAALAPGRVVSLTLLSSIGVQEYELLGDYHLNHAVHAFQLAGLWLLREAVPHFGRFDGGFFGVEYARNFYDSDQRPLRQALARFAGPVLIIQGDKDPLVQPGIAYEHARIVPQSELVMLRDSLANHFMAFTRPGELAPIVADFAGRVDAGTALTRATATPERLAAAALPFDPGSVPRVSGLALVILLALLAAATLASEDLACITAGLMVGRGTVGFAGAAVACGVGIVGGDLLLFAAGRWLGRPAVRRAPLRWFVSDADIERSSAWFRRFGVWIAFITRFVPGTRLPTYLAAGILHTRALAFLAVFILASLLWTPLLVGASALFGGRVLAAFTQYRRFAMPTLLGIALGLLLVVKLVVPLCSWRGRRLLLSRWRRLTRWEYWPRWVFYPPVVAHVLGLGLRHRNLLLWTAGNPAIPGGGFVGESKAAILEGLGPDQRVARWSRIGPGVEPGARVAELRAFLAREGLDYPVVLKPDIGERGGGVAVISDEPAARHYLSRSQGALLAQEYVRGIELGIFYYRIPGEPRGRIFAITDKQFPEVTGDGHRNLEELILAGDRTVALAKVFLRRHAARLTEVPAAGGVVPLLELGTHCRGATFSDGEWARTPALEAAIDRLSQRYDGFWFGRYDVRAESAEALRRGEGFKVLELNGVSSEATNIYDPRNSLAGAYRVLRRQWSILFEIAARNVAAGARPARVGEMLDLIHRHRQAVRGHVDG